MIYLLSKNRDKLVLILVGIAVGLPKKSSQLPVRSRPHSSAVVNALGKNISHPLEILLDLGAALICNAKEPY